MTATRYASIALSRRVVACGNIIFKPSETTPNNLIGRCREKSLLICIGFNIFQHLSVASPKTVVYVTMDWLPLKCMGLEYHVARNGVMGLHRKQSDEKSLLICIGFNFFQLLSVVTPETVVYVTMDWLPLKCMGFRISRRS